MIFTSARQYITLRFNDIPTYLRIMITLPICINYLMKYLWGGLKSNYFDCLLKKLLNKINQKKIIFYAWDLIEYVLINFPYYVKSFFKPDKPSSKVYKHLIEITNSLLQTHCFILIDNFIGNTKNMLLIGRNLSCNKIMNVLLNKWHIRFRSVFTLRLWLYLSMNMLFL